MDHKQHWEQVYTTKASDAVSWFQKHSELSLALIHQSGLGKDASIIDVGGGASSLVDDLLLQGYLNVTVLDLSSVAIEVAKGRLVKKGHQVQVDWLVGDITHAKLPDNTFDIWHDRAVFHFLTDFADRQLYISSLKKSVRAGGHVIIATFAEDGPEKCSGLPVVRYTSETLQNALGHSFELISSQKEAHYTPFNTVQQFVYCHFRKIGK